MTEPTLQVNPHFSPDLSAVGNEITPLVVIDEFALNLQSYVDECIRSLWFDIDRTSAYPGIRAKLNRGHVIPTIKVILVLLYKAYKIPKYLKPKLQSAFFSLVTKQPSELELLQRVPHFDSNRHRYLAVTHYLDAGSHGGTGLFRHRPTGFENVGEDRVNRYISAGQEYLERNGEPARAYFTASDKHYELYEVIDYRPNRLVVYPGSLLHSGLIDPLTDISSNPSGGRLTANIFVDFQ
jgi:hypothetical protein